MKTTLQNFFKVKKNKIIVCLILAFTILAGAGFYLNSRVQEQKKIDQARIEKEKAEEQAKKEQEEKEKIELAKAEEAKKKAEELEKEKQKQAEEDKAKVEQQKAEVDKREKENFVENKSNSEKKETQKNSNSTSKKTENSKKNKKKDNNNNNNNNSNKDNTFEVEGDGYSTVLGNSGRFFSSKSEADNWAFAQLENDDSNWSKSGYRRFSTSQCKRNGQIGWTVNFRK